MDIELNILQNWIQESDNIVFISGADLSAEAGFPDYRIMTQADWARYKYAPDEILRLTFLQRNPFYFYRYYREKILAPVLTAQPSPAHEALAHLGHFDGKHRRNPSGGGQPGGIGASRLCDAQLVRQV